MSKLPKIEKPIFELELPSTKEKVRYTPFSVKEEKILLIAQESKDPEQAILAIKQIVNNCLIDKEVDDLPIFDLEYILLTLRSRSVDNNVSFSIKDPETSERVELNLDLENVKIEFNENHNNKIKINDEYFLILRYPTIEEFIKIVKGDPKDPMLNYFVMVSCLDKLVGNEEVYKFSDFSEEEIEQFMDNLQGEVITMIKMFFETMPKLRHEIKYKNKNGNEKTFVIEGTQSFFI